MLASTINQTTIKMNNIEKTLTNRKNNAIEAFKVAIAALDDQQFGSLNIAEDNKKVLKKWISAKTLKLQKLVNKVSTSTWFDGYTYETREYDEKKWEDVDYGAEVFGDVTLRTARA